MTSDKPSAGTAAVTSAARSTSNTATSADTGSADAAAATLSLEALRQYVKRLRAEAKDAVE